MVFVGEFTAILVAVPLGVLATRSERIGWIGMNAGAQTIPPLTVIALSFIPLGLGQYPVILALFFYALSFTPAAVAVQVADTSITIARL